MNVGMDIVQPRLERNYTFNATRSGNKSNEIKGDLGIQRVWQSAYSNSKEPHASCASNKVNSASNSTVSERLSSVGCSRPPDEIDGPRVYTSVAPQKRPFSDVESSENTRLHTVNSFKTAREQLAIDQQRKYGGSSRGGQGQLTSASYGTVKKSLGTRRGLNSKFVPPVLLNRDDEYSDGGSGALLRKAGPANSRSAHTNSEEPIDERLKNIEPKMVELITNEIMDHGPAVVWEDIGRPGLREEDD